MVASVFRLSVPARQALAKLTLPVLFVASFGVILLGKVDTLVADRARPRSGTRWHRFMPLWRCRSTEAAER